MSSCMVSVPTTRMVPASAGLDMVACAKVGLTKRSPSIAVTKCVRCSGNLPTLGLNWRSCTDDGLRFVVRPGFTVQHALCLDVVEFAFPFSHHDGGNPIADEIGERPHLRHEAVHTE